jgi:hypothetical protein
MSGAERFLRLLCGCAGFLLLASPASAQGIQTSGDPYAHGLRLLAFPVTFTTGVSQSSFGSGLRAELDLGRVLMLQAGGGASWVTVGGEDILVPYDLRLGVSIALYDRVSVQSLEGTVYATDAAAVGGQRRGTDSDLEVPVSQKLGGPPPPLRDLGEYERAAVREVHALRVGYDHRRWVHGRGELRSDARVHALTLGYGWGSHWNLMPHEAGERSLGYRRFYVDLMFAPPFAYEAIDAAPPDPELPPRTISDSAFGGIRLGMEGAFAALLRSAEALGFGYSIELGALAANGRAEGYLLIGLGLALEIDTSQR